MPWPLLIFCLRSATELWLKTGGFSCTLLPGEGMHHLLFLLSPGDRRGLMKLELVKRLCFSLGNVLIKSCACVSFTTFIIIQELKYSPFAATGKLPEILFERFSTAFQSIFKEKRKKFYQNAIFHLKIFQLKFSCQF